MFLLSAIVVVGQAFWLWMLFDSAIKQVDNKLVWILVVLLGQFIGALVYYFAARKPRLQAAMR